MKALHTERGPEWEPQMTEVVARTRCLYDYIGQGVGSWLLGISMLCLLLVGWVHRGLLGYLGSLSLFMLLGLPSWNYLRSIALAVCYCADVLNSPIRLIMDLGHLGLGLEGRKGALLVPIKCFSINLFLTDSLYLLPSSFRDTQWQNPHSLPVIHI